MSTYRVTNFTIETTKKDLDKLELALKKVQGVRNVSFAVGRKEFSIKCTGMEPNYNVLKDICMSAGFQIGRKW